MTGILQTDRNQRFVFIDGLRGFSALCVVIFHLNSAIKSHNPEALPHFVEQFFLMGYLGLQIFFVLSGFVIAYTTRYAELDFAYFARFFLRRSLRLDPPYWIILGMTVILAGVASFTFKEGEHFPFSASQIFYNLFYLPDLMQVPLIVPVAWTLCIEFQFYIVFVLLLILLKRVGLNHLFNAWIWGFLALFSLMQTTPWAILPSQPLTFIPYWYSFFLGAATCWTLMRKMEAKILWSLYLMIGLGSFWTPTLHAIVSVVVALIIFIVFTLHEQNRFLNIGFLQYIGKISYSLYLVHWPVGMKLIDSAYKLIDPTRLLPYTPLLTLMSFGLATLVADLFYRWIEGPSHQLSRYFSHRKQKGLFTQKN